MDLQPRHFRSGFVLLGKSYVSDRRFLMRRSIGLPDWLKSVGTAKSAASEKRVAELPDEKAEAVVRALRGKRMRAFATRLFVRVSRAIPPIWVRLYVREDGKPFWLNAEYSDAVFPDAVAWATDSAIFDHPGAKWTRIVMGVELGDAGKDSDLPSASVMKAIIRAELAEIRKGREK